MPSGIAKLFSILPSIELFKRIEIVLSNKGIRIELPETNKVQVWTSEGEMLQVEKEELLKESKDISNYLIQFWWSQMDDISIKLVREGQLCVCNIYLDGLDESQSGDILDLLVSMTIHSSENVGFIFDRKELSSELDWARFFNSKEYLGSRPLEQCSLKVYKKYKLNDDNREQLIGFERDYVYVAIPNRESGTITIYLLS